MIANGNCPEAQRLAGTDDHANVMWGGQPEALNRLLGGFSLKMLDVLVEQGMPQENLGPIMTAIRAQTATPLVEAPMPVQDAIALADFLVRTTKEYVRFLPGADVVGGDTDLATVTKHEGFKWIRRKHYYKRELNQLETDHV